MDLSACVNILRLYCPRAHYMPAIKGERSSPFDCCKFLLTSLVSAIQLYFGLFYEDVEVRFIPILWSFIFNFRSQSLQHRAQVTPASK